MSGDLSGSFAPVGKQTRRPHSPLRKQAHDYRLLKYNNRRQSPRSGHFRRGTEKWGKKTRKMWNVMNCMASTDMRWARQLSSSFHMARVIDIWRWERAAAAADDRHHGNFPRSESPGENGRFLPPHTLIKTGLPWLVRLSLSLSRCFACSERQGGGGEVGGGAFMTAQILYLSVARAHAA